MASKPLNFYCTGINNLLNRWQQFIDVQESYFDQLKNFLNLFRNKTLFPNQVIFSGKPNEIVALTLLGFGISEEFGYEIFKREAMC